MNYGKHPITGRKYTTRAVKAGDPVGTEVTVHRDNGELFDTVTRSEVGTGPRCSIWVVGIAGSYMIDRIRLREVAP